MEDLATTAGITARFGFCIRSVALEMPFMAKAVTWVRIPPSPLKCCDGRVLGRVFRGYLPAVFLSKPRLSKILSTVGMPRRCGGLRQVRHFANGSLVLLRTSLSIRQSAIALGMFCCVAPKDGVRFGRVGRSNRHHMEPANPTRCRKSVLAIVPKVGPEPTRVLPHRILSPVLLPSAWRWKHVVATLKAVDFEPVTMPA